MVMVDGWMLTLYMIDVISSMSSGSWTLPTAFPSGLAWTGPASCWTTTATGGSRKENKRHDNEVAWEGYPSEEKKEKNRNGRQSHLSISTRYAKTCFYIGKVRECPLCQVDYPRDRQVPITHCGLRYTQEPRSTLKWFGDISRWFGTRTVSDSALVTVSIKKNRRSTP